MFHKRCFHSTLCCNCMRCFIKLFTNDFQVLLCLHIILMMLELPSEVNDLKIKYLRMPKKKKVVESNDEWDKCGMWILINPCNGMSWIDETWINLQVLLEKGYLIMIKASTAAHSGSPADRGVILCYTKPGEEEIERAAREIRKIVPYEHCMYYKINKLSQNKISRRNGHKRIPQYMHTVKGFLYRDNAEEFWTLVNESDSKAQNPRRNPQIPIDFDIENLAETDFDDLPSRSKNVFLTVQLKNEIHHKKTFKSCIHMKCSMTDVENSLYEADRLWMAGKKLFNEGDIDKITCKKASTVAEFNFFLLEKLDIDSLVKLCDKIRYASQVFRFMYIKTNDTKHRYSPEKELNGF